MAKDHTPGGFDRPSGYKSDLEIAEENGTRVNTSFGSQNHNVYVHNDEHTHEHFWYDPDTCSSGYHGANVPTKSNHPNMEAKEMTQETQTSQEITTETPQEVSTETPSEVSAESPEEVSTETPSEVSAESPEEVSTETPAEVEADDGLDDGGEDCDDGLDV